MNWYWYRVRELALPCSLFKWTKVHGQTVLSETAVKSEETHQKWVTDTLIILFPFNAM